MIDTASKSRDEVMIRTDPRDQIVRSLVRITVVFLIGIGAVVSAPSKSRLKPIEKLVKEIQRADYEGNRVQLRKLYDALKPFADDPKFGAFVSYWRGFAMWRRALNGFNDSVDRVELDEDLKVAIHEFEDALAKDGSFIDARIAAGSCLLNRLFIHQKEQDRVREFLSKAIPLLDEAASQEPHNPRLLWVRGSSKWYRPPARGGGQDQAILTYHAGLDSVRALKQTPKRPLSPSWGEPELLMNLSWSHLNATTPDLNKAERYAREALALVPYWHYVKDILVPQIAAAKSKMKP